MADSISETPDNRLVKGFMMAATQQLVSAIGAIQPSGPMHPSLADAPQLVPLAMSHS